MDGINMGITHSDNRISLGSNAINTYISGGDMETTWQGITICQ